MHTVDRINHLLDRCDLPRLPDCMNIITGGEGSYTYPNIIRPPLHEVLNHLDSAIGADTEFLPGVKCECPGHINGACHHRRAVGARLRMIEEIMALNDLKQQFMVG